MEREREAEREERAEREGKDKREHEFRMRQLEVTSQARSHQVAEGGSFNVAVQAKLVPEFAESDVDKYLLAFEKAAESLGWPRDKWAILIWTKLKGKALAAYAALDVDQAADYDLLKKEILNAYELVPEAYRLKFRRLQKQPRSTHVEFAREKAILCDRWLMSLGVQGSYEKLRELVLLEEFKQSIATDVRTYLEEHKYDRLQDAAISADEYFLTHKPTKSGFG